ncbi:hypothetical protein SAY86_027599 [Trapa natans]|uniref:MINDY deubiquitinase domain-containing protein n=1 Tax=Trapa natans TaxID=22666 RepID=A0AAN7KLU3_TRANT|nr:hypothetical protein SAY86_027599 [Trapa natans]
MEEQHHQRSIPKEKESIHKTKIIQFLGRTTPVILQNDNGPCPLLAICNVLLLRNNLNLSPDTAEVSQERLLSLVAERLIDSNCNVNNKDDEYLENQQKNIADAIDLLPRLTTGIDVNIEFKRIGDFEFTPECAIFDLLDIPLYHGWIVDPQDHETANAITNKSYNAIMGELVALDAQGVEDARGVVSKMKLTLHQGELVRNFLKNNVSQLTFYGLFCLQDGLKEHELCVFFRNNHFSTMFKYQGELYLLAIDQGYINQPNLVWEKLNEVNGDTLFMTGNFKEFNVENQSSGTWDEHNAVPNTADYIASIDSAAKAGLDVNLDLQLAIALQQKEFEQQQQQRQGSQQTSIGSSRLVTGPQVPRNNLIYAPSSNGAHAKSNDKCSIM